ncbi:MAG: tRNA (adenosine(37)-N6)-threonylcarbamoyltransferase complex transferase subunit TsaD [Pirellulales bacterium]|nr:tRNA (adenosine(37)-N6)-threonylcarbamoyltransferase complex transferase subunit TsaD [Pirellulales bacterium]
MSMFRSESILLAIETTCDETAAAVISSNSISGHIKILASVVASQDDLHRRFGGVVPEIASRAHVERILPVLDEALHQAGIALDDLDAVAVATSPGLAGSLLVGLVAAKTLCVTHNLPLVAVDHLHAHLYACRMAAGEEIFPCVGLVVSGGHSHLFRCKTPTDFELLGGTIDDAAGEAFDKVAALLGLPYPGGPAIAKAAEQGDRTKYAFPRPLLHDATRIAFSFSGLKTAVRYLLEKWRPEPVPSESGSQQTPRLDEHPGEQHVQFPSQVIADVAASFESAVIDCLVGKAELALARTGLTTLCVGGGVAANQWLREQLAAKAESHGFRLLLAPMPLCTDNAAMGAIAMERLKAGLVEPLDLDIRPGLVR